MVIILFMISKFTFYYITNNYDELRVSTFYEIINTNAIHTIAILL